MTPDTPTDRLRIMQQFVEQNPTAPFPRYGLALELAKRERLGEALTQFDELRRRHPDYLATYLQQGMLLARVGKRDAARQAFQQGIQVSLAQEDAHTRSELEEALVELGQEG